MRRCKLLLLLRPLRIVLLLELLRDRRHRGGCPIIAELLLLTTRISCILLLKRLLSIASGLSLHRLLLTIACSLWELLGSLLSIRGLAEATLLIHDGLCRRGGEWSDVEQAIR